MDLFNGDVVHSQALLEQWPPGVTYVRYGDALASGELFEHGRRRTKPAWSRTSIRAAARMRTFGS